jgi:hypothetical protein
MSFHPFGSTNVIKFNLKSTDANLQSCNNVINSPLRLSVNDTTTF